MCVTLVCRKIPGYAGLQNHCTRGCGTSHYLFNGYIMFFVFHGQKMASAAGQ